MKYIVTGGAGFIGSHLVDHLVNRGHEVISIDDESAECNEEFYWNTKCTKVVADVCDYDKIQPFFKGVSCVFHLAAESRIQPTLKDPTKATRTNVLGTCNILQASRVNDVDRVILSSTSSAYGLKNDPPLVETMSNDCLNPYSVTKVAGEELCKMYTSLFGLKTIIFRYFNVFGEREPVKGQYAPVIGIFLKQSKNGEAMTIVGDGLQTRDFTHVQDVVQANMIASTTQNQEAFGQIFNIGSGTSCTILSISAMIGGEYVHIPNREGEARHTLANLEKSKRVLGYEPTISLETYIEEKKNVAVL